MRVLVTGGAGFIGSHIAARMLDAGAEVVVYDNLSTGSRANLAGLDVRLIEGDVRDATALASAMAGCEVIFHEAAVVSVPRSIDDPQLSHDVNIQGTLNVLIAARAAAVRRVVFAGSAAIYGDEPTLPKHEQMLPAPIAPYGVEKICSELYLKAWPRLYGVETVTLRYFNVFGPRQDPTSPYSGVISIFVKRALEGGTPSVFGDGLQTRDFVFVGDVAEANYLAATKEGVSGETFNVARGEETTLLDLLSMLGRIVDRDLTPIHAESRSGDIRRSVADLSHARARLGFDPAVPVEEGLRQLVRWARGQ